MKTLRIVVPAAVMALVAGAAEPLNIRPGYWSVTTTMTTGGAPLYIEGIPNANSDSYAKSWAKEVGKPKTNTDDDCITEKDIKDSDFFKDLKDDAKSCKQTITKQTATAVQASIECKGEKTLTKTEIDYSVASPTAFKGTLKSTITSPNGTTTMSIAMSGKWTAASCPAGEGDDEDE